MLLLRFTKQIRLQKKQINLLLRRPHSSMVHSKGLDAFDTRPRPSDPASGSYGCRSITDARLTAFYRYLRGMDKGAVNLFQVSVGKGLTVHQQDKMFEIADAES